VTPTLHLQDYARAIRGQTIMQDGKWRLEDTGESETNRFAVLHAGRILIANYGRVNTMKGSSILMLAASHC
jgi:hypothetical protein